MRAAIRSIGARRPTVAGNWAKQPERLRYGTGDQHRERARRSLAALDGLLPTLPTRATGRNADDLCTG